MRAPLQGGGEAFLKTQRRGCVWADDDEEIIPYVDNIAASIVLADRLQLLQMQCRNGAKFCKNGVGHRTPVTGSSVPNFLY